MYNRMFVKGQEQGMGLVDALVGTVIIGVAGIGLMMGFIQATRSSKSNTTDVQAVYIAQGIMEKLKKNDNQTAADLNLSVPSSITQDNVVYDIALTTPTVTTALDEHLLPRRISVSWQEGSRRRQIQMTDYFYIQ